MLYNFFNSFILIHGIPKIYCRTPGFLGTQFEDYWYILIKINSHCLNVYVLIILNNTKVEVSKLMNVLVFLFPSTLYKLYSTKITFIFTVHWIYYFLLQFLLKSQRKINKNRIPENFSYLWNFPWGFFNFGNPINDFKLSNNFFIMSMRSWTNASTHFILWAVHIVSLIFLYMDWMEIA